MQGQSKQIETEQTHLGRVGLGPEEGAREETCEFDKRLDDMAHTHIHTLSTRQGPAFSSVSARLDRQIISLGPLVMITLAPGQVTKAHRRGEG